MSLVTETVPATRVVVTGESSYMLASRAAYEHAVAVLGTDRLNLADCTKRLADGAFLFTYTVIALGSDLLATR